MPGTTGVFGTLDQLHAAAWAVGVTRYYLDPTIPITDHDRLIGIRRAMRDLSDALGFTPTAGLTDEHLSEGER